MLYVQVGGVTYLQVGRWVWSHIYHWVINAPGGRSDDRGLPLLLAFTMSEIGSDAMEGGEAPPVVVKRRPKVVVNGVISMNHHRPKSEYICPSECVCVGWMCVRQALHRLSVGALLALILW